MVMKVLAPPTSYTLHPHDVEMVYRAIRCYADELANLREWVREDRKDMSPAIANISEEIRAYRELALDIYATALSPAHKVPTVERAPFAGRAALAKEEP